MEPLKNKLWIWGHPTNSLKNAFGLKGDSAVSPAEGMAELGATGIIYVPMGQKCDRRACNAEMSPAARTGWSIESEEDVDDLIAQKKSFPSLTLGIFDDFFSEANAERNFTRYSPEKMVAMREKLHAAGLEMWVVFYTMQIGLSVWQEYLRIFDGVTLWLWDEPTNGEFDEKCRWFFSQTPNQKRMLGCYLYNFGKECPATAGSVRYQLDRGLEYLKEGSLSGIILHTNAVGGMGFSAYDEAARWSKEHGDLLL